MNSPNISRRRFLKTSACVGAALAFSARSWSQVTGANSDVRVAVIGLNGRGKHHLQTLKLKGVRVAALCDADSAVLAAAKASLGDNHGPVKTYTDLRDLFAAKDIDAVTIATPNHWHSLAGIWACQAGKDVYVEKPVSHNIWEGRQLVAAAGKYHRVMQAGTQIRSSEGVREAVAWVQAGQLGKIIAARGFCYKRRPSIGKVQGTPQAPATVDLDLWCGPAPYGVPHRTKFHYDWHWQYVTGNGDVGNQGIHQMDVARWFLGEKGLPRHTLSIGGRLGYEDDGDTPNTQVVIHDYPTAPLIFEVRGLPARFDPESKNAGATGSDAAAAAAGTMDRYLVPGLTDVKKYGVSVGNVVDCEGGSVVINGNRVFAFDRAAKLMKEFVGNDRLMANFIDVVRSRKTSDLYGAIEEGHISSALCHLGNISHQIGRATAPGELAEKTRGNPPLAEAYGRMTEHLKSNHVDLGLAQTPATLGAVLTVNSAAENFTGEHAAEANAYLKRAYRAPYLVPQLA